MQPSDNHPSGPSGTAIQVSTDGPAGYSADPTSTTTSAISGDIRARTCVGRPATPTCSTAGASAQAASSARPITASSFTSTAAASHVVEKHALCEKACAHEIAISTRTTCTTYAGGRTDRARPRGTTPAAPRRIACASRIRGRATSRTSGARRPRRTASATRGDEQSE